jgi:uncharacterized protein YegP (UPF0339 family)
MGHYVLKKSTKATAEPFYFVLKASNGQVIAQSEMYSSKAAAHKGIESVQKNASSTDVHDETE